MGDRLATTFLGGPHDGAEMVWKNMPPGVVHLVHLSDDYEATAEHKYVLVANHGDTGGFYAYEYEDTVEYANG